MADPSQRVFRYDDGNAPSLDDKNLLGIVAEADPQVYDDLRASLTLEQQQDKRELVAWLYKFHRPMFELCDQVITGYQTAFHAAVETERMLKQAYSRYRMMRSTLELREYEDPRQMVPEEPAKTPKGKRRADPVEKKMSEGRLKAARSDEQQLYEAYYKPVDNVRLTSFYSKKEPWETSGIDVDDYVHFVRKGRSKLQLGILRDYGSWKWLYHCPGASFAEELAAQLEGEHGATCLVIKKRRGGADAEVYSYKVVSGSLWSDPKPVAAPVVAPAAVIEV